MKILFKIGCFWLCVFSVYAQDKNVVVGVELNTGASTAKTLPFWLTANKYGAIPTSDYGSLNAYIGKGFKQNENDWDIAYKGSFTGYLATENSVFVNELYASVRYKGILLTVGNKYDAVQWEGLSSSNGNFLKSTNSRAMPGINFETNGFVSVGFWKDWFSIKANYAEYLMNDDRIVDGAHAHNKSLHFKFKTSEKFSFSVGLDDWAQWAGTNPVHGELIYDFNAYIRMVLGKARSASDVTSTDKLNALGNHMGNYSIQLHHLGDQFNWDFYWSHPFEDKSGRELQNWPDALYGLAIELKNPKGLVSHLVTEVTYTKNASGSETHYLDENGVDVPKRGRDRYFKNAQYNSGWSYFGRTIGTPYIITEVNEEGVVTGPDLSYNRLLAFNIGTKGFIQEKVAYKMLFSYVHYYAWFDEEFETTPRQFSGFAEFDISSLLNWPIGVEFGTSFDLGNRLPDNVGGFLKIYKRLEF
ncbi:hypothetical protein ACFQ5N_10270 [Lutibacter holmesii]|uniref:Capsule assembly Wzi family protein n=1 Tax=Lutibacter holmesii TaxID=1137985 RepID=A0ABW3WP91_9FLAO